MTGPEHYLVAERALENVDEIARDGAKDTQAIIASIEFAQAHATLALAAATAGAQPHGSVQWRSVLEGKG